MVKKNQLNTHNSKSTIYYIENYLEGIVSAIFRLKKEDIEKTINELVALKKRGGRLFFIGVGGGAANTSHAVNDFRKICNIEAYTPTDNVAEITARTNDDGWETVFVNWLKASKFNKKDAVMVFSVGGGDIKKNVSVNIVHSLELAKKVGATILGIVSRDGGYTKKVADVCILVPIITDEMITPYAESFQVILWHLIVFHPRLRSIEPY